MEKKSNGWYNKKIKISPSAFSWEMPHFLTTLVAKRLFGIMSIFLFYLKETASVKINSLKQSLL